MLSKVALLAFFAVTVSVLLSASGAMGKKAHHSEMDEHHQDNLRSTHHDLIHRQKARGFNDFLAKLNICRGTYHKVCTMGGYGHPNCCDNSGYNCVCYCTEDTYYECHNN